MKGWNAAIGSVTNLAAHLCAEATGSQVLGERKIMAPVEGLFEAVEIGPLVLKSLTHPVPAFAVAALPARTP